MRSETTSLLTVLTVTAIMSTPTALGVEAMAVPSGEAAAQAPTNDTAKFAGTYSLITTEQKDKATGKWAAAPTFNSNGYIIYSSTGQMAVHIQPKTRVGFTSNPPKDEEIQEALRGYTAYFGTFTVNEKEKFVTHHRVGQINPGGVVDAKRYYDFVTTPLGRERLILTPAQMNTGSKEEATNRSIWERHPHAPLSAAQRKFVGFWKLLYTDNYRTKNGKQTFHGLGQQEGGKDESQAGTSYIIYTDSGHMMAHLMDNSGRTAYADAQPTPAESRKAYESYGGYFGRFVTYENQSPPFVIHSQQGTTTPGEYSDQERFFQFTGDVLRLGRPPTLNAAGELAGRHLYWRKMKQGER